MQEEDLRQESSSVGLTPRDYVDIVLRLWWLILLIVGTAVAAGVYYADSQDSVYESTARIVIETSSAPILSDVAPVVDTGGQTLWMAREYMETQLRILTSSSVAAEVAVQLGLEHDLEFLGLSATTDPAELEAALARANPVRAVQSAVTIEPVRDSRVVAIRARAPRAQLAADLANKLAEVFIARNAARQLESTQSAVTWLQTQYDTLRGDLEASERALVEFRQEHNIIAVNLAENLSLSSRMEATSSQLADARLEADRARTAVEQIDAALAADPDILTADIAVLSDNTLIQALKSEIFAIETERIALGARYLPGHPEMQALGERETLARARLLDEVENVVSSHRQQATRAASIVRSLESRLAEVENDVQRLGTHQVEYSSLVREAEANRALFELIERRRKEVELTRNSLHNNVELLEVAPVVSSPIAPKKQAIIGVSAVVGLLLAIGVVLAIGLGDDTVKDQATVERVFGLTFLGLIPRIQPALAARRSARGPARGDKWSPDTFVHEFPKSPAAEACRSVRTNLTFLASETPMRTILVTSAGTRDGKTATCVNLATVMAQAGTRVLIVDADMRKPRLSLVFGATAQSPGLSSLLGADASITECARPTQIPGIDMIPSGPVPSNPAELLDSEAFRTLLSDLVKVYDRVVIDSPPVNPVTDAAIIAGVADAVVTVIRAGSTRRSMVVRALEALTAVNANIVGAILNDVDLSKRKGGYYYYYRQYAEYYGDAENRDAA